MKTKNMLNICVCVLDVLSQTTSSLLPKEWGHECLSVYLCIKGLPAPNYITPLVQIRSMLLRRTPHFSFGSWSSLKCVRMMPLR